MKNIKKKISSGFSFALDSVKKAQELVDRIEHLKTSFKKTFSCFAHHSDGQGDYIDLHKKVDDLKYNATGNAPDDFADVLQ